MKSAALVNHGHMIRSGKPPLGSGEGRTYLITGVARSGTTLAATILHEAGLHLGTFLADVVHEDRELLAILQAGQRPLLDEAKARRNAEHRDWGFKIPNLHAYLRHDDLARFRNPHLILIFRDPIAVAVRNEISEMFDPITALSDTVNAQHSIVQFLDRSDCPCLLTSYEKALIFPESFVEALTSFCALSPDADTRQRMIGLVQPNPDSYLQSARRQFAGSIDTLQDGVLLGWCCQIDELEPVDLALLVDGQTVTTVRADQFRTDLLKAGFGNGCHGFSVDVVRFGIAERATIRLVVSGRTYEVPKSGLPLAAYTVSIPGENRAPMSDLADLEAGSG